LDFLLSGTGAPASWRRNRELELELELELQGSSGAPRWLQFAPGLQAGGGEGSKAELQS